MQGIFVIAERDGETLTFRTGNNSNESSRLVLDVTQGRSEVIDRAIVRFEGSGMLPKFMFNPDNTRLYIPQDGTDYAVVSRGMVNATPVSFKAKENGTYTLAVDFVNLDLEYLHLIDNMTGADVDLLQTPSYTFEAHTTDYAERFQLVYATTTGIDGAEAPFAYYADGEIRLFVETQDFASLQVVDMLGHVVRDCRDATCRVSTTGMTPGVYMLRLMDGNNVRTQKIVID